MYVLVLCHGLMFIIACYFLLHLNTMLHAAPLSHRITVYVSQLGGALKVSYSCFLRAGSRVWPHPGAPGSPDKKSLIFVVERPPAPPEREEIAHS